jgi:hypothetical protein
MTSPQLPPDASLLGRDLLADYAAALARWRGGERSARVVLGAAVALNRLGSHAEALAVLRRLGPRTRLAAGERREAYGIRAGAHKGLWQRAPRGPAAAHRLRQALADYERAFRADGDPWPAVNLATLHRLSGDGAAAEAWARRTLAALAERGADDGWAEATKAEALLVLGRLDESAACYARAPFVRERRWNDRAAARRQARALLLARGLAPEQVGAWLDAALPGPTVGVVVGHMLDLPGRAQARLPAEREPALAAALAAWVRTNGVELLVASAASGTDILAHEAVRAAGGASRVMLHAPAEGFAAASVAPAGPDWVRRFERLLAAHPAWVSVAALQPIGARSAWYEYGNEVLEGLALLTADQLEAPVRRLAVWDGLAGDGPGGTASTVRRWRARGVAFEVLDPARLGAGPRRETPGGARAAEAHAPEVLGLLAADASGFSGLDDDQLARFAEHVLPRVRRVIERSAERGAAPVHVATWGDGLLLAYEDLGALAHAALDLRDAVARERWDAVGLPRTLSLRIAVHAGPVRRVENPVTGRLDLLGSHVAHVVRLEPVTPPGAVFATEGFAALARLRAPDDATLTLAGKAPWAKGYGEALGGLPLYRLERAPPPERTADQ